MQLLLGTQGMPSDFPFLSSSMTVASSSKCGAGAAPEELLSEFESFKWQGEHRVCQNRHELRKVRRIP